MSLTRTLIVGLFLSAVAPAARGAPSDPSSAKVEAAGASSPRESVAQFLDLCRTGQLQAAGAMIQSPPGSSPAVAAEHLKAVLDRYVWFDMDHLSAAPEGDVKDDLPLDEEDVGKFPIGRGRTAPVRLIRIGDDPSATWLFSRSTVAAAEEAYQRLSNRWLLDHLPGPLLRPGPKNLLWWQWLALPMLLIVAWLLGVGLGGVTRKVLARVVNRTKGVWDDQLVARLGGPLALGWSLATLYALMPMLGLYPPAEAFITKGVQALVVVSVFWILLRLVDVSGQAVGDRFKAKGNLTFVPLIALGVRSAKGVVLALGTVAVLAQLGYPVTSLIAGLGVGGLALALAAQKTVENLFGAFSLAVDQPIREGDFVKIEEFVGTVEAIGLRSTRIRTLERTLISIPNGKLADMRLESLTARDRLRLFVNLGLVRETTAAQMRAVIAGVESVLGAQEKVATGFTVRFAGIDDARLNVEMYCYIDSIDWNFYTACRQELLLQFMEVVEKAGTRLAYPTRTLQMGTGALPPAGAKIESHTG